MADGVLLTTELGEAIQQVAQQWLRNGRRFEGAGASPGAGRAAPSSPIVQIIRVSSVAPDTYGYPCYVQFWDGIAWNDATNQARAITPLVDTVSAATISPGAQTVAPESMVGITVGAALLVDPETANSETVTVLAITGTTFTATFANGHSTAPVKIQANGTLLGTTYKARLMRVEGNGLFIYAVAAADARGAATTIDPLAISDDKGDGFPASSIRINNSSASHAKTTLSGAIDNVTTTITVASFFGFPTVPFFIVIGTEVIQVTGISGPGTTWTVVRGDGGTIATAHPDGAPIDVAQVTMDDAASGQRGMIGVGVGQQVLGSGPKKAPSDFEVGGNLTVDGSGNIGGLLNVTGTITATGNINAAGHALSGATAFGGDIYAISYGGALPTPMGFHCWSQPNDLTNYYPGYDAWPINIANPIRGHYTDGLGTGMVFSGGILNGIAISQGCIYYGTGSNALYDGGGAISQLGIGSVGQVLTVVDLNPGGSPILAPRWGSGGFTGTY